VFPSWADNKAVRDSNNWQEGTELNLTNTNFTETKLNSFVIEVKTLKVSKSSSLLDLVLEVLLDGGDMLKPKTVRVDK
jgi:hypothetical protein